MKKFQTTGAIIAVVGAVVLSLFNHWEMSGETWGYWYFARVFDETGRFIIPDRSPMYILYLSVFRGLGYPLSVTVEYLVTSAIVITAIVALFKRYFGLGVAIFAVILWIPFLQTAEPPVQKLALACSCLAIAVRRTEGDSFQLALSYALFGIAYMFRCTYIVVIPLFAAWDVYRVIRIKGVKGLSAIRPRFSHWPVGIVLCLLVWFVVAQSPHPYNNVWFSSTRWFPSNGKSFMNVGFVMSFDSKHIEKKYGTSEGMDSYFTNQEFFGGADNMLSAIRANPGLVIEEVLRNVRGLASVMVFRMDVSKVLYRLPLRHLLLLITLVVVLYGACRSSIDKSIPMFLFVLANGLLVGTTVISTPKGRYMFPLIPVLFLSAYWYGGQVRTILSRVSKRQNGGLITFSRHLWVPLFLVLFSTGTTDWLNIVKNAVNDIRHGEVRMMEARSNSMKASFDSLNSVAQGCKGVMSLEHTFNNAFMNIPLDRIYDIWEIPPFGRLGDEVYDGLNPDRIDCVLVSHELRTGIGCPTNYRIRYQNFVKPYVKKLQDIGAITYDIPGYGQAVVLPKSRF